jgi:ABC-type transporter Mla subunit MlaD
MSAPIRTALVCVLCSGAAAAGCSGDGDWALGAPRTVRTTLARAEGVGVGTRVVMAGVPVGVVTAVDTAGVAASDSRARLVLEIRRPEAPLRAGLRAEVRPAGLLVPDVVVLVPGPADAPPLPEGAEVPGAPRAATAAERRAAMRVVLPAVGLPALGALAQDPPRPRSPESARRAPHR